MLSGMVTPPAFVIGVLAAGDADDGRRPGASSCTSATRGWPASARPTRRFAARSNHCWRLTRRAGQFLRASALASSGAADVVTSVARESLGLVAGRRIGPYEIIRELGHGGMGVVYLAARADLAFEKQVAVKVVRAGAATDLVLQRFHAERRILATLDHPHIARLLDGGVTPDGLSYFVMEYVDGVPLDAYCEKTGLSLEQRIALFRRVCAAVQYAHQRLVIHRDSSRATSWSPAMAPLSSSISASPSCSTTRAMPGTRSRGARSRSSTRARSRFAASQWRSRAMSTPSACCSTT